MATRNTRVLKRIISALGIKPQNKALAVLEAAFSDELLLVAGTVEQVAAHAQELRLRITPSERLTVLDYIARKALASISIDTTEEAINALFRDRFIEP